MLEYKREKQTLEAQLKDVQKRSVDHDDHLRVIDAWWSQVSGVLSPKFLSQSNNLYSFSMKSGFSLKMLLLAPLM